jgi:isoleucyl-tRNA synthetase
MARTLLTRESVMAVARHIGQRGSSSWFTDSPREILGDDFALPEGFDLDQLRKEENIFDVWFESAVAGTASRWRPAGRCRSICTSKGRISIAAGSSFRCCRR